MGGFGFFGRKSLPDLDEEIDLDKLSSPNDSELLNELKKELEELKKQQPEKQSAKKIKTSNKIKDFKSIVEIEYFLKEIDDAFFKQNMDIIKQKIIEFIDKVLPETALSFEISLLGDKGKLLNKIHVIREVYGDLTLGKSRTSKSEAKQKKEAVETNPKDNEDKKPSIKFKTDEDENAVNGVEAKGNIDFDKQAEAIHILRLVDPKEAIKLDSKNIRSLEELKSFIETLPEKKFNLLVLPLNRRKNIANWIEHVIGYPELAEKLMLCETRDEIHSVLDEMYERVKDLVVYGKINSEEENVNLLPDSDSNELESDKPSTENTNKDSDLDKESQKNNMNIKTPILKSESNAELEDENFQEVSELDQQNENNLSRILEQLPLLSEEQFKQKRPEIFNIFLKNKISKKELLLFVKCKTKDEFAQTLEEFLYSRPEFENSLKKLTKDETTSLEKELSSILALTQIKESISDEAPIEETNQPETQQKTKKRSIFKFGTEKKTDAVASNQKSPKLNPEPQLDSQLVLQDDLSNIKRQTTLNQKVGNKQNPKLENAFSGSIKSYDSNTASRLKDDENFFDYLSQLKQELEVMKEKNLDLNVLPPPTLDDKAQPSQFEKGLFDLVKPEVNESLFDAKERSVEKISQQDTFTKTKDELINTLMSDKPDTKQAFKEQNTQQIKGLGLDNIGFNHQAEEIKETVKINSLEEFEKQLLEKERELLEKKIELLKRKRELERENLNKLMQNIELQDALLSKLSEERPSIEDNFETKSQNQGLSNEQKTKTLADNKLKTQSLSIQEAHQGAKVVKPENSNELFEVKKAIDEIQKTVSEINRKLTSTEKEDLFNQSNVTIKTFKESARDTTKNNEQILNNADEFSLDDLISLVDNFLGRDSFDDAEKIIMKARNLIKNNRTLNSKRESNNKTLATKTTTHQFKTVEASSQSSKSQKSLDAFKVGQESKTQESKTKDNSELNSKTENLVQESSSPNFDNIESVSKIQEDEGLKAVSKINNQDLAQNVDSQTLNKILQEIDLHLSQNNLDEADKIIREASKLINAKESFESH